MNIVPLFHPRTQHWDEHFARIGQFIQEISETGRAMVEVLAMNALNRRVLRGETSP